MRRTFGEINDKLRSGRAVILTAGEFVALARESGVKAAFEAVDVVTTATFGAMCSSGAFLNFGHADPPIRMEHITLNGVEASGGLAAVDTYLAATTPSVEKGDEYGGAHVIEELIAGHEVTLRATAKGTDCYPRREIVTRVSLKDFNQAYLYNPRNCYQNYAAAANSAESVKHTYMGVLLPRCANVTYSTSGEYSPLLKDPELRTIGMGTRVFFNGAQGYVAWEGTQAVSGRSVREDGETQYGGYTLALVGDMRGMDPEFVCGATFERYGVTLFNGVGIPIPVLDLDLAEKLARGNDRLFTEVLDYGCGRRSKPVLARVSYAELRSGSILLNGRRVPTAPLSSLSRAIKIAGILKGWLMSGSFLLNEPVQPLPPRPEGLKTLGER